MRKTVALICFLAILVFAVGLISFSEIAAAQILPVSLDAREVIFDIFGEKGLRPRFFALNIPLSSSTKSF